METPREQIESHQARLEATRRVIGDSLTESALLHGKPVPTSSSDVWSLLWQLQSARFRVAMALASAQQVLSERRLQVLLPKDKDLTEMHRAYTMEAGASDEIANVKRLELAYDLLGERVQLLAQFAAYVDTESKRGLDHGQGQAGDKGDTQANEARPEENNV